ncbi:hypothetical protein GCM10007922_10480 [Shewanella decolorationis]|nr:hypothetical protein GCM10007922_10480 [Shewanella decolorationis]
MNVDQLHFAILMPIAILAENQNTYDSQCCGYRSINVLGISLLCGLNLGID